MDCVFSTKKLLAMSRFSLLFLGLLSLSLLGCRKKFQGLEVPYVLWVEMPAGLNPILTHYLRVPDIPGLQDSTVRSVLPAFPRLVVEDGENTVDFIREAYLEIRTEAGWREIAYRLDAPRGLGRNFDLIASPVDIKPQVQGDFYELRIRLRLNYSPTVISRMRLEYTLQVQD